MATVAAITGGELPIDRTLDSFDLSDVLHRVKPKNAQLIYASFLAK
jgi:hypothetical protein